jgi:hypothetical protein
LEQAVLQRNNSNSRVRNRGGDGTAFASRTACPVWVTPPTPAIKNCVVRNKSRACGARTAVESKFNPSKLKLFQFNARSSIGSNFNFLKLGHKKTQNSLLLERQDLR